MSKEFLFPDVGEGIAEGKLAEWKVSVGDEVEEDQALADVETDKAVVEIPSPQAGKIESLEAEAGDTIKVGEVLLRFKGEDDQQPPEKGSQDEETEQKSSQEPKTKNHEVEDDHERPPEKGTKNIESTLTPQAPKPEEHEPPITVQEQKSDAQGPVEQKNKRVLAAPSTRRLAREKGIDLHEVQGSGPAGRILKSDLDNTQATTPQKQTTTKEPDQKETSSEKVSYSGRRKAIGEHMQKSSEVPAVTEFATANAMAVMELREHLKDKAEENGVKLTYLSFFAKALCAALRKYPRLNSHFKNDEITVHDNIHLGIAVDTEQGLIVPVIEDADKKGALEVAKDIQTLAQKARENTLENSDIQGSTFSISNIGKSRVDYFTPMINTPEAAILGIGGMYEKPLVVQGAVIPQTVVPLSVTYDHRVVDGAEAARFLSYLVELIEDPELLVLGGI